MPPRWPLTRAALLYCATLAALCGLELLAAATPPADPPFDLATAAAPRIIHHGRFAYAFSPVTGSAVFAVEYLTAADLAGQAPRVNSFRADDQIPEPLRATNADYEASGFDRGHLAAADDHRTPDAKAATFCLSNMTPQEPALNRGLWRKIEATARDLVDDRTDVCLVTIPLADYRRNKPRTIGPRHVFIPTHYAKAALLLRDDKPHAMRAWIVPNAAPPEGATPDDYLVDVDQVEAASQLDLFAILPDDVERRLEATPPARHP